RRDRELAALRERTDPVDLVVIGGGITGVGIALDAASRGLDTVLLEAHDLAFGTSRWSSKLAHGGLRYLASGNVGIARRSALERGILLERTAPHLVRPLAQVVPVHRGTGTLNTILPGLGFVAGTALSRLAGTDSATLPGARLLSASKVAEYVPGVRRDGLRFGHLNWDGQLVDDSRLVVGVARTAAGHGARILTRARVTEASGTQVTVRDESGGGEGGGDGEEFTLTARQVVNATGVWAGETAPGVRVRPSRGTHLVVRADALGNPTGALTVPVPGETNRFCFCLPAQSGRVYVGLTDVDAPGPVPDVPHATEEEIDFLLDVVGRALESPLTRDDGLITITGGKLTEYRLMAEQAVDLVVERTGLAAGSCHTPDLPLIGAPGHPETSTSPAGYLPAALVERFGLESAAVVAASVLDRPLEPVAEGLDVTRAEFSHAVTHEGALSVDDVLDRRSRVGLVPTDRAAAEPAAREAIAAGQAPA